MTSAPAAQRVFVTAGAGGIGRAVALALADSGARVHIVDINEEAVGSVVSEHESITGSVGDVTDAADMDRVFAEMTDVLGGLDVMVSNAGVAGATAPVEEYDPAAWQAALDVNLTGSFNVAARAVPLLKESRDGTYLVMSSLAGRYGYPNRIGYSTAKWGLVGFMKTLALELGEWGITVNSIHPGAVEGPRLEKVFEGRAEVSGRSVEEEKDLALANQSIKKFIDPQDIASLMLFLASPAARTISGQQFSIDSNSKAAQ